MSTRTKILVVIHDLDILSRIYLALVHRNYKAEASDKWEEIPERLKRFKPSLIILGKKEFELAGQNWKLPGIVLTTAGGRVEGVPDEFVVLSQPFTIDTLMQKIETLVI